MDLITNVGTFSSVFPTHGLRAPSILVTAGIAVAVAATPVGGDVVPIGCGVPVALPDPADLACQPKRNTQCVAPLAPFVGYSAEYCGTKSGTGGTSVDCGFHAATGGGC